MDVTNKPQSGDYSNSYNLTVFNNIAENSVCLDVGCWVGNLGSLLIDKKNCTVDGIDFKQEVLDEALAKGYKNVFKVNFNNENYSLDKIPNNYYDYIIFADVLEHLIDPSLVIEVLKAKLKPSGKILISLPNVAFLLNRVLLALGKWEYKEFGTLDKTHLRFFTISSGSKFVTNAGYKIIKVEPYNQFGILRYIKPLDSIFPSLLCYQFLLLAELDTHDK